MMFGLLSTHSKYNDIIRPFIALAPVTTVGHLESPIKYVAHSKSMVDFFKWHGGAFLPSMKWVQWISDKGCPKREIGILCSDVMFVLCGFDGKQLNTTRTPVYVAHTPAGTSSWNMVSYMNF